MVLLGLFIPLGVTARRCRLLTPDRTSEPQGLGRLPGAVSGRWRRLNAGIVNQS
jgi:hypothetical protein